MHTIPGPHGSEIGTYSAFAVLNPGRLDYQKNLDKARTSAMPVHIETTYLNHEAMMQERQRLIDLLGEHGTYLVGSGAVGRDACLEMAAHQLHPCCPAWATEEEKATFQARVQALRATPATEA